MCCTLRTKSYRPRYLFSFQGIDTLDVCVEKASKKLHENLIAGEPVLLKPQGGGKT